MAALGLILVVLYGPEGDDRVPDQKGGATEGDDGPAPLAVDGEGASARGTRSSPRPRAWTDWPWKLHRIQGKKGATFELYNLKDDPMEARNLAKSQPERLAAMQKKLDAWQSSVIRSLNGKDY